MSEFERREEWLGAEHVVRPVRGSSEPGTYRCPGCDQEIAKAKPHVVVWPAQGWLGDPVDDRRHWHTACWAGRTQRAPTTRRSGRSPRH